MAYRFLMINTDYGQFLEHLYRDDPGLWARSFDEQHAARMQMHFGVNDYYSSNLRKLGHEAIDLQYNNHFIQYAWAVENGLMPRRSEHDKDFIKSLPEDWLAAVFQAQIKMYKPDVIVDMAMQPVTWKVLDLVKPDVPLIIGQYGSPVFHEMEKLSVYDIFISACHEYVGRFHKEGKICEHFKLGFESAIFDSIDTGSDRPIDVAFVGGFTHHHTKGTDLINYLAEQDISMALYGYDKGSLSPQAQRYFNGELFGKDMFKLYSKAKIVINRHTNIANSVGNLRLYEATGMGACLLTDDMKDLDLLFAPGKEVATYSSPQQCAKLIRYYLAHEDERKQIALNGQRRTLSEHTYYHRMTKLADIADNYLRKGGMSPNKSTSSLPNAISPQKNLGISTDISGSHSVNEFEKLKNSQTYTLSGSLDIVLKTIRKNLESFPRRVPGKLNLDGRDFYYADLHSFYYQSMQIFADKNYDFESEVDAPIIIDCGAHIGLASIFFAGRYPNATIYAFEADPLIAQMCEENIRSFGLSDRIKVFNKAVWTHNNGIQFNASCDDSGHIAGNKTSGEITTPSVRLRDLIQDQPIEYIKMDIEGSEFEVIKDCKEALSNVNKIIVEVHQLGKMPGASSELLKVLEESNFSYVFDDLHSAPWVEEFKKPPFARLKTDKYYLTVYAWQQSKVSNNQDWTRSVLTCNESTGTNFEA